MMNQDADLGNRGLLTEERWMHNLENLGGVPGYHPAPCTLHLAHLQPASSFKLGFRKVTKNGQACSGTAEL